MIDTLETLPDDPAKLRHIAQLLLNEVKSLTYQIEKLKAQLSAHNKARFGSKSESMDQMSFGLQEDEELARANEDQQRSRAARAAEDDAAAPKPKRTHGRKPLPEHLDREEEVLTPGDVCGDCGGDLKPLGEDVTEELP